MKSRLIFLVVFATVVKCSPVNQARSDFSKIRTAEVVTSDGFIRGLRLLFNRTVDAYSTSGSLGNQSARSEAYSSEIETVKPEVVRAFVSAYDGIMAGVRVLDPEGVCARTTNRDAVIAETQHAIDLCFDTLESIGKGKNLSASLNEIEANREKVVSIFATIISTIFDSIANVSSRDPKVVAVIDTVRVNAISRFTEGFNAYFAAPEILLVENHFGSQNKNSGGLDLILTAEIMAISAIKDEVRIKFDLVRILFMIKYGDNLEIVNFFSQMLSSQAATMAGFETGLKTIFSTIADNLSKVVGRRKYAIRDNSSTSENPASKTTAAFISAYAGIGKGIQALLAGDAAEATEDQGEVNAVIGYNIELIYDAAQLASESKNSSLTSSKIADNKKEVIGTVVNIFTSVYEAIADVSSTEEDVVAAIKRVKDQAILSVVIAFRAVFKFIEILLAAVTSREYDRIRDNYLTVRVLTESLSVTLLNHEVRIKFELTRNLLIHKFANRYGMDVDLSVIEAV